MGNVLEENQQVERICFGMEVSNEESPLSPLSGNLSQALGRPDRREIQERFDEYLAEAVDEAITTLGEPVKNTLYQHLECDFCMCKQEIPGRIEEFDDIIHKIFGLGASRLEFKFIRNLDEKINGKIDEAEFELSLSKWIDMEISFKEYLKVIRKDFEQNQKTR